MHSASVAKPIKGPTVCYCHCVYIVMPHAYRPTHTHVLSKVRKEKKSEIYIHTFIASSVDVSLSHNPIK